MSKNNITMTEKVDYFEKGGKGLPTSTPNTSSATVTPPTTAPAATVTPPEEKEETGTPPEEKEETGTPSVSVSGGVASNQTPRYNTEAESKLSRELAYNGVLYERMKKYMPLQQKRAGMGNMGIAQTGLAQITGDHMNRRSDILSLYQEEIANASLANSGTDEKTTAAIAAFKDSISSYDSAESAQVGLDALGLEKTDPQYIALKTQIEGYFRDKADTERDERLEGVIGNLGNYTDENAALTALGYVLDPTDPLYSQYETQIKGYFRDKTTSSYNKAMEEIWNYPDSATALAHIETLDTTGWTQQQIEQLKARAALLDYKSPEEIAQGQENALAAYNSQLAIKMQANSGDTDAMYALLESFKDRLSPDAYETAKMELDAYANDPQRQYETKQNEMSQQEYIDGMLMLDAADKAGYSDADEYKEAVLAGEQTIKTAEGAEIKIINSNPADTTKSKNLTQSELNNLPEGTVQYLYGTGMKSGYYVKFDGKWYLSSMGDIWSLIGLR